MSEEMINKAVRKSSGPGFTLLEILVSIAIFAVVATMIYSSLNAVLSKNEAIKDGGAVYEMAKMTLNRISMDLSAAFVAQYPEYQAPGITDPSDPYRFHGDEAFIGGSTASEVSFASNEHLGISSDIVSGLGRITYYAERSGDRDDDTLVLKRSDIPFPYDIDPGQPLKADDDPVVCEKVESFRLTYVDEEGQTHQTWDSDSERHRFATPRAVIVEIALAGKSGTHTFSTRVDIPVYRERLDDVRRQ